MLRSRFLGTAALATALLALMGCSSAREELGLTRRSPDEFAVYKRAPLELPPDYTLRPPVPGEPRPQEQTPEQQAATLFSAQRTQPAATSNAENALLKKTGGDQADPSIRATVNAETGDMADQETPTIKRLINLGGTGEAPGKVIDPVAESERLKNAKTSSQTSEQ